MKIRYLGTAAAEGIPAIFCNCNVCTTARKLGGKNLRTRSQALINDVLLIDFPPDTYMHYLTYNFDLPNITNLLVTHSHTDHFYATDLEMRCEPLAYPNPPIMHIYGNNAVREMFYNKMPSTYNVINNFEIINATPFVTMKVGDYEVTPLLANHDKKEECLIYIINQGDKTLLYANDTGDFPQATWEYLKNNKQYFDLVSLDCTMMKFTEGTNHMGLQDNIKVKEKLFDIGIANKDTIFVVNHFSHNGGWTNEELDKYTKNEGFLASYDGLEIKF